MNETLYTHPESGFTTKDKDMFDAIVKTYKDIKYKEEYRKKREEEYAQRAIKDKEQKVKRIKYRNLNNELEPIRKEWRDYLKLKNSYQSSSHKEAISKMEEYTTEIKKLQLAWKMISGNLRSFKSDSGKEYVKNFPFKLANKKKSLEAKIAKIKF